MGGVARDDTTDITKAHDVLAVLQNNNSFLTTRLFSPVKYGWGSTPEKTPVFQKRLAVIGRAYRRIVD